MTQEEFTRQLPPFAHNDLRVTPPLMFRGVSARFFPLRASLGILQQLCDSYLNIVPPEAGCFRVPTPYVYLVVLDYGQMGETQMRTGWFSQVEVYFGLAVEWYKRVRGQWVFHDWGVVTPYIFVNDDVSVPVGRTVFGFPKVLATVERSASQWMKNPVGSTTLARISTTVFPEAYTGGDLVNRVFLEIDRSSVSNMRVPVDTTATPMPWAIAANLANAVGGFGRDALWMAQSMRISPINPLAGPGIMPEMLRRMMPSFAPGGKGFVLNSLNVKQFRRAENPSQICYRALTNGCMQTTALNQAGLLGEMQTLCGDLSGGHTIRLYQHSSLPIVQTLGLEVFSTQTIDGQTVSELKPVMPFWADLDLKYGDWTNVAWQTSDGVWKDAAGAPFDGKASPDPPYNNTVSTTIEAISGPFEFTGTTVRVIPLLASRSTLEKFLKAQINGAIQGPMFNEDGSKAPYAVRFDLWARGKQAINEGEAFGGDFAYVYLTASSFGGVISASDNVGDWAKYELAFMIPVKWQRMKIEDWEREQERKKAGEQKSKDGGQGEANTAPEENDAWETVGVGMIPAFTLADNCITAFSRLEIQGIATATANFVRPESVWLGEGDQAKTEQTLLRVDVELLPALGAGQKATFQPAIEIVRNDPTCGLGSAPDAAWHWAEDLRHELGMKKGRKQQYFQQIKVARALSLELLGNQTPFSLYTLKEFRDATDPNRACYQSIVRVPRVLGEVFDVREIEETLAVRIFGYPSMNIVEELGLKANRLDSACAGIAYAMQGLRPFYIRTTLREPLGERLMWRAGRSPWTVESPAFNTMLSDEPGAPQIVVDMKAEQLQDQMDPSRTAETMYQARQRREAGPLPLDDIITVPMARQAVEFIDPQIVIESMLSREWSNFDPEARWRKGHLDLLTGFGELPQAGELKPFAESELFRRENNKMAAPPGAVAAPISKRFMDAPDATSDNAEQQYGTPEFNIVWRNLEGEGAADRWRAEVKKIIQSQTRFAALRLDLERCIDLLSPLAILGEQGLEAAYEQINEERIKAKQAPLSVPGPEELFTIGQTLLATLRSIQRTGVQGEPSPHNNLDTVALANEDRLGEMYDLLVRVLSDDAREQDSFETKLAKAAAHATEIAQMEALARSKCQVQFEALVNKFSRAYQKPDFCLRRDAFSLADRDRLLPLSLSWDVNWYYGDTITLNSELVSGIMKLNDAPCEAQLNPTASTPAMDQISRSTPKEIE